MWYVVWPARVAVLLATVLTMQHILQLQGYRTTVSELLAFALMGIVVVRIWMPWEKPGRV